jgi:RimJ/RimL family protein N-acetyltransferase
MTGGPNHMLAQQRVQELRPDAYRECRGRRRGDASGGKSDNALLHLAGDSRGFVLYDNRIVRIRPLRLTDRAKYEKAVAGLSARSRYLRFAAPIPRMSERLLDQMMQFDGNRHVVYAALTRDETMVVGVARYVKSPADPRSAEVAIAVADDWQGHGLGRELLGRIIERARLAGLESLTATTLRENRAAARLLRAAGFSLARRAGIHTEYERRLDPVVGGTSNYDRARDHTATVLPVVPA